ncbi:hypothetical protein GCM10022251_19590 [Phytohabitans flavus]|uniref:Uncharacterized protein n=1 Tax=Phytohabitans flavus TaxID=1076124 RepID=A0A6F8XZ57_9ACTN|nr:hypothetical protein [Phytohabitans flavus]BCB79134.1 hypothetical protein Pflav_055440 [Phytohabitans flavus]
MAAESATDRALIARLAAHTKWAGTEDRTAATAAARAAFVDHFEREVDPDGVLDPAERAARAASAKKAFYTRMALRSAQVRRARRKARNVNTTSPATA